MEQEIELYKRDILAILENEFLSDEDINDIFDDVSILDDMGIDVFSLF